ncbi:BnaC03g59430D [Brassica napus]|uniref:BnaC03g59430D protein n=1 Tax=Brassica napus TaxID=3708 RepID=A0A078H9Z0_BRANA|nr:BnaC03g59430D [Brassica napus]
MEPTGDSPDSSDRKTGKKIIASSSTVKPNGKSIASFAIVKTAVSSTIPVRPNVATTLSSAHADQVMFFRDVSFGPREAELRFRLIHFWEARNPLTKTLIGQEMLLINGEGTAIQGFVPAGRVGTFDLTDGVVYKLSNFFGSRRKVQYRVVDHIATVSFTWNSVLSVLENPPVPIPDDRFRFHGYEEFKANCDSRGDLYGKSVGLLMIFA